MGPQNEVRRYQNDDGRKWIVDTPQEITARIVRVFEKDIASDARNSYHSWEHCYSSFASGPTNLDLASLHLAFCLASWGLYRGSAAIRNYDYLIHRPVVEELVKHEYALCAAPL